jgi:plastocyanin
MRQVNRTPLAASLAVALVAVVALALASPVSAAGHAVAIRDSSFGPKTITIRAGDRITWTNTGSNNHNVTFDAFASEEQMAPGAKYVHTFRSAGTFSYTCTLHGFTGTVVVKAAATPKPKPTVSPSPTAASSLAVAGSPGATASSAAPAAASSVAGPSASPGGGAAGDASQTGASGAPLALLVAIVAVGVVAVGAVVVRRR